MLNILHKIFSFTDWQKNHPKDPPPGDMLDSSFDTLQSGLQSVSDQVDVARKVADTAIAVRTAEIEALEDAAGYSEAWARTSALWAEHMPDTIPASALASLDISGDHWSARWWAHQAANTVTGQAGTGVVIGSTPPPNPADGQLWWQDTTGNTYIYVTDADMSSSQWVQVNYGPGGSNKEVYVEDYGAVGDGTAASGTDDSAAFTAALAASRRVLVRNKTSRYFIKNVDIPSGRILDLQGAIIQPAPGASYCVKLAGDGAACLGGDWRDSPDNLLKTTTLTVAASVGATTVTVADASAFTVEGLIVVVADESNGITAGYGGPRKRVHHCLVSAKAGSVLTLSEPLRYAAASGNVVATSLGFIVNEAGNCTVDGHRGTTAALFGTIRSASGTNNGKNRWANIEANTLSLGCILTTGSVSSVSYENIRGYLGASLKPYIAGFGIKIDGSTATSTRGGHHLTRCDMLGTQEGFDLQKSEYDSYTDCYADTIEQAGYRIGNQTDKVIITGAWSAFVGKGISISKSSDIFIHSMFTDTRTATVSWGQNIDLEVSDDSALIYVSRGGWRKSRLMRADAGWQTINNITLGPDITFLEDGSAAAPSLAFRLDTDTGIRRPSANRIELMVGGLRGLLITEAQTAVLGGPLQLAGTAATISGGSGTPEGVVTATKGSLFLRNDGAAGTAFYVKESGTGNTGWVAK